MKSILIATGAALLLRTAAHADPAAELATTQAQVGMAAKATDLPTAQKHLRQALNCLVGPKGADYVASAGNPCQGQGPGLMAATNLDVNKQVKFQVAHSHVLAALVTPALPYAQQTAAEAQRVLGEAK